MSGGKNGRKSDLRTRLVLWAILLYSIGLAAMIAEDLLSHTFF